MIAFQHRTQSIIEHKPPASCGDCQRACLAMVLGIEPAEVPHFADEKIYAPDASRAAECEWLAARGFAYIQIPILGEWGMDYIRSQILLTATASAVIISGRSPRGKWNHDVVMFRGEIYDPHPDRTGLAGPCIATEQGEPEWFWLHFLSPLYADGSGRPPGGVPSL